MLFVPNFEQTSGVTGAHLSIQTIQTILLYFYAMFYFKVHDVRLWRHKDTASGRPLGYIGGGV